MQAGAGTIRFRSKRGKADMSKTTTMNVEIRFADCDPAGIVFFPRCHRWMDASPLLAHHARFAKSAAYGEKLAITTRVEAWRAKVFLHKHTVMRGDDLICERLETRVVCTRDPQDRQCIHGIPVPEDIRRLCE